MVAVTAPREAQAERSGAGRVRDVGAGQAVAFAIGEVRGVSRVAGRGGLATRPWPDNFFADLARSRLLAPTSSADQLDRTTSPRLEYARPREPAKDRPGSRPGPARRAICTLRAVAHPPTHGVASPDGPQSLQFRAMVMVSGVRLPGPWAWRFVSDLLALKNTRDRP